MIDKPICEECKHRMMVKMIIVGQAQANNGGRIQVIGPVRQEVLQSVCKLAPIPITNNPCVVECSEFEAAEQQPELKKPIYVAAQGRA